MKDPNSDIDDDPPPTSRVYTGDEVNAKVERAAELVEVWGTKWAVTKIARLIRNLKVDPS